MEEELPTSSEPPQVDPIIEPSRVDPMTNRTQADAGTKLYVIFFMLIVPALGFGILVTVFWKVLNAFLNS